MSRLTAREEEVFSGIRSGLSQKEIAAVLGVSQNTARNHTKRIYQKLGVHSRGQVMTVERQPNEVNCRIKKSGRLEVQLSLEQMAEILRDAGYSVTKEEK